MMTKKEQRKKIVTDTWPRLYKNILLVQTRSTNLPALFQFLFAVCIHFMKKKCTKVTPNVKSAKKCELKDLIQTEIEARKILSWYLLYDTGMVQIYL